MKKFLIGLLFLLPLAVIAQTTPTAEQQKAFAKLSVELNSINQQLQQIYQVQQKAIELLPRKNTFPIKVVPKDNSIIVASIEKGATVEVLGFEDDLVKISLDGNVEYLSKENFIQVMMNSMILKLHQLQQEYRNNRYIAIRNFNVNLGMPPSINLNLAFIPLDPARVS